MQINTQFNVGESVYFLHEDQIYHRPIRSIHIEARQSMLAVITYFFDSIPKLSGGSDLYKYENELGATVADLIHKIPVNEPRETT
jgi:hypothetical protein